MDAVEDLALPPSGDILSDLMTKSELPSVTNSSGQPGIGAGTFPDDPKLIVVHPIPREQGLKLIGMMGLNFDGDGDFQLSRELGDA